MNPVLKGSAGGQAVEGKNMIFLRKKFIQCLQWKMNAYFIEQVHIDIK